MATGDISGSKLYLKPNGYKAGLLMSEQPTDGTGDFTFARASKKNRINSDLKLESINNDVPPLSYDGSCPFLDLEPQGTNLITYPLSLDNAYWTKTGSSIDNNGGAGYSAPSVDYPNSAFKLIENNINTQHLIFSQVLTTDSTTEVFSVFAKKGERNWIMIKDAYSGKYGYFDLNNGVIGTTSGTTSIKGLENGWYKCSLVITGGWPNVRMDIYTSTNGSDASSGYLGDGTSGVYLFANQSENNEYPTSFIFSGTEGSTSTRLADLPSKTGINSLIGGTSGTIYFKIKTNKILSSNTYKNIFYYQDATSAKSNMYVNATNYIQTSVNLGALTSSVQLQPDTIYKVALVYDVNDFKLYIDSVLVDSGLSGTPIDAVDILSLGSFSGSSEWNEFKFLQYTHYKIKLTATEISNL